MKNIKGNKIAAVGLAALLSCVGVLNAAADAFTGFVMSPMAQMLILDPGDTYTGSLTLSNPANNEMAVGYQLDVRSFYRDDSNNAIFEDVDGRGQMADWITIDSPLTGSIEPNQTMRVNYTINVPTDAPAGGQYASIVATTMSPENDNPNNATMIKESVAMAYMIYAEVTGNVVHQGKVTNVDVPGFIFNGNITGSATIENTGNVHDIATYTMQVYPLFSDEEVFTNEEDPASATILPNRTRYIETAWENTPTIGIFNVVYTVEFEGVTTQVSKMVIKCPIWLLFIILFIIAALIIWIVMRVRHHKKPTKKKTATPVSTE
ncbi:hypothetical protein IKF89_01755 [Candidatus Saccharibacteria bacterium]|nr:hypothetical protein [Candidatus Saccharibacteria bacterium]